jgi:hypothetical protein
MTSAANSHLAFTNCSGMPSLVRPIFRATIIVHLPEVPMVLCDVPEVIGAFGALCARGRNWKRGFENGDVGRNCRRGQSQAKDLSGVLVRHAHEHLAERDVRFSILFAMSLEYTKVFFTSSSKMRRMLLSQRGHRRVWFIVRACNS